jgi:hypothetical protein
MPVEAEEAPKLLVELVPVLVAVAVAVQAESMPQERQELLILVAEVEHPVHNQQQAEQAVLELLL